MIVIDVSGSKFYNTHNCNFVLEGCENIFRARATTFATTTVLLLIHAYNCKNLAASMRTMDVSIYPREGEEGRGRITADGLFLRLYAHCEHKVTYSAFFH